MWRTISSKEIFSHPRLTLIEDKIILPNGHQTSYLKYKDDGNCSVAMIAKMDNKILLEREYSYPQNLKIFQFPGGHISKNEKPKKGANRELMEEVGYRANKLELLGSCLTNQRRSTQKMYVFLASDLIEESLKNDDEEEIEKFWFTEDQIAKMIKNNEIIDMHSLAAWCLYKS